MMKARITAGALGGLAGAAAWLSMGVLAVVDEGTRARVGALPPVWMLAALVAAFVGAVLVRGLPAARVSPLALTALIVLPWLPGRIPAAFLIWYGPSVAAVWTLVVLGLAAPALARVGTWSWCAAPGRAPWLAALLAAGAFAVGAFTLRDRMPAGDEPHYLVITQSLLTDGDLRIENNHARGDYFSYFNGELRPDYLERGQDGQIYSIHAPGISVLLAPPFALGGYPLSVATLVALSALGVALLWRVSWRLSGSIGGAWLAASAYALTAPGFFHAFTIFPDGAGAVATTVALWALVRLERGAGLPAAGLVAAGAALAALPWLHTRFAVVSAALGAAIGLRLLARADRVRALGAFLIVPLVSAASWFAFFWLIWGTPNPSAPYGSGTDSALANVGRGLAGLLADQQFGLASNAPIYAVGFIGMAALVRRHCRLALELAAIVAAYALAVASYQMWWGGYSAPARFLVAILPAVALPLAVGWSHATNGGRALALVLLFVSVLNVIARVAIDAGALLYNPRDGFDLLLDWANRSVNLPLAAPSLHRGLLPDAIRDIAVWVLSGALLATAAVWAARRWPPQAWLLACAWLTIAVSMSASLVWADYAQIVTSHTSSLDLVHRWPNAWHATGWQSRPYRLIAAEDVLGRLELASTSRGPRGEGAAPLFTAPLVPAGEYEIAVQGRARPAGRLTVTVGRTTQVLEVVNLSGHEGGLTGLIIALPVRVHSLTIRGDEQAQATVERLTLRPVRVLEDEGRAEGLALRATRYGGARAFFLDDSAFMEPAGFWTRGEATTDVVFDTRRVDGQDEAPPALTIRAGPVPTSAILSSGDWSERVDLPPGSSRAIALPDRGARRVWRLRVDTASGFRPARHEAGSRDYRHLGVWFELR